MTWGALINSTETTALTSDVVVSYRLLLCMIFAGFEKNVWFTSINVLLLKDSFYSLPIVLIICTWLTNNATKKVQVQKYFRQMILLSSSNMDESQTWRGHFSK